MQSERPFQRAGAEGERRNPQGKIHTKPEEITWKPLRNNLGNHKETTLKTKCSSGVLHQSVVGVTCSTWENFLSPGASWKHLLKSLCNQMWPSCVVTWICCWDLYILWPLDYALFDFCFHLKDFGHSGIWWNNGGSRQEKEEYCIFLPLVFGNLRSPRKCSRNVWEEEEEAWV